MPRPSIEACEGLRGLSRPFPKKSQRKRPLRYTERMDMERNMQFIVEHLAKLTASAEKHDERIVELQALAGQHDEQIAKLEASVSTVADLVGRLAQAEIRLVERMDGHEVRLQSLESKMAQFLERMDRFIQGLEGNGHKP